MSFPNVKRVAYSTCSIYSEENEAVVKAVLSQNPSYELVNIAKDWPSAKGDP